ncbi:hypothetical protein Droror1_Dr00013866 [Drosera rotundifolia]
MEEQTNDCSSTMSSTVSCSEPDDYVYLASEDVDQPFPWIYNLDDLTNDRLPTMSFTTSFLEPEDYSHLSYNDDVNQQDRLVYEMAKVRRYHEDSDDEDSDDEDSDEEDSDEEEESLSDDKAEPRETAYEVLQEIYELLGVLLKQIEEERAQVEEDAPRKHDEQQIKTKDKIN